MEFIAALGALAGLYVLLRKDILDVKQELKADIGRVEDRLLGRIDAQDGRFERLDGRFELIDAGFDRVDGRFELIDAGFDRVDGRFDRVDARFDRVDARFDRLEAKIDQVRGELIAHLQGGHPPAA